MYVIQWALYQERKVSRKRKDVDLDCALLRRPWKSEKRFLQMKPKDLLIGRVDVGLIPDAANQNS